MPEASVVYEPRSDDIPPQLSLQNVRVYLDLGTQVNIFLGCPDAFSDLSLFNNFSEDTDDGLEANLGNH